jgi:putative DNA primase/helicase
VLDVVRTVLGDYGMQTSPKLLLEGRKDTDADKATPALAALEGARFVMCQEPTQGVRFDASVLKQLTGGMLSVRSNYGNTREMPVTFHIFLLCNPKPKVDADKAIEDRILMLPFDRRWNRPDLPNKDPTLPDGDRWLTKALLKNGEAVLAWLVKGAVAYFKCGLRAVPACVVEATKGYIAEQRADPLGKWLSECTTPCSAKKGTRARDAFKAFDAWRVNQEAAGTLKGDAPMNETDFGRAMRTHGIDKAPGRAFASYGIRLREFEPAEVEPDEAAKAETALFLAGLV